MLNGLFLNHGRITRQKTGHSPYIKRRVYPMLHGINWGKIGYGIKADNLTNQYVHIVSLNLSSRKKSKDELNFVSQSSIKNKSKKSKKYDNKLIKIKASILNARSGPAKTYNIVGKVKYGQIFSTIDEQWS